MSSQQTTGVVVLLLGVAAFIVSIGVAWTPSRSSCARHVDATWLVMTLSVLSFLAGVAACSFGVSFIVEG